MSMGLQYLSFDHVDGPSFLGVIYHDIHLLVNCVCIIMWWWKHNPDKQPLIMI